MNHLLGAILSCSVAVLYLAFSRAEQVPSYIKPCVITDKECIIKSTQSAVPTFVAGGTELGLTSLDPFEQKEVKINLAGLHMDLRDFVFTGLKDSIIDDVRINQAKKKHTIEYHSDLNFNAKYKMSGRLLVIPLEGEGDAEVYIKKIHFKITYGYELVKGPDGKEYLHVQNHKITWQIHDHAHFNFTNLFNGNKQLATTTLAILNANWQGVTTELAPVILDLIGNQIVDNIRILFKKVPLEQLQLTTQ